MRRWLWALLSGALLVAVVVVVIVWRPLTPAAPIPTTCDGRPATLTGNASTRELVGTDGDDVIVGVGSARIVAGAGHDVICSPTVDGDDIDAGPGDDLIIGGTIIRGGPGRDRFRVTNATLVEGGPGDDRIESAGLAGTLDGGDGNDVIISGGSNTLTTGGAGNDTITETDGHDTQGGAGDDRLIGHGTGNLNGGEGDDRVEADTRSTVTMWDGPGDDTYRAGGNPAVTVNYYLSKRAVRIDLSAQRATGQGRDRLLGVRSVAGSHQDDTIIGDEHNNALTGLTWWEGEPDEAAAAGADRMSGGAGDDVIEALGPGSIARGEAGDDTIRVSGRGFGGPGADRLDGSDGDDDLRGGPGRDVIDGGDGADRCTGEVVSRCER